MMDRKRNLIREITSSAYSLLEYYHSLETRGLTDSEHAKEEAKSALSKIRYGEELKDYLWITDPDAEQGPILGVLSICHEGASADVSPDDVRDLVLQNLLVRVITGYQHHLSSINRDCLVFIGPTQHIQRLSWANYHTLRKSGIEMLLGGSLMLGYLLKNGVYGS